MPYPKAVMEKLLKKSNMRVSRKAVEEFGELLEEITIDLTSEAISNAKLSGRKTILAEDIKKAIKLLK